MFFVFLLHASRPDSLMKILFVSKRNFDFFEEERVGGNDMVSEQSPKTSKLGEILSHFSCLCWYVVNKKGREGDRGG